MGDGEGAFRAALRRFRRRLAFVTLALGAGFFAMALSFLLVRWMTHQVVEEPYTDPVLQQRAQLLRGFANDLTRACNDYVAIALKPDGTLNPEAQTWLDRVYRSDLRFLELRMDNNPMSSIPAYVTLRAAAGRCATMARYPADIALRRAALSDARAAIHAATDFITEIAMDREAGEAPLTIRFDKALQ